MKQQPTTNSNQEVTSPILFLTLKIRIVRLFTVSENCLAVRTRIPIVPISDITYGRDRMYALSATGCIDRLLKSFSLFSCLSSKKYLREKKASLDVILAVADESVVQ